MLEKDKPKDTNIKSWSNGNMMTRLLSGEFGKMAQRQAEELKSFRERMGIRCGDIKSPLNSEIDDALTADPF